MTTKNYSVCLSKEQIKILSSLIDYTKKIHFDILLHGIQYAGYGYMFNDQTKSRYTYKVVSHKDHITLKKYKKFYSERTELNIYTDGVIVELMRGLT